MTERLLVRLEGKAVTDDGPGEVSGLASTYGTVDLQNDAFQPGAFDRTIHDWTHAKAKAPLLDWHGDSLRRLIGSVVELKSTPLGLWFRAKFASSPEAQAAHQQVKEGHLSGVSVGWLPIRASREWVGDRMVRLIHEARLLEISLTPVPANPEAQLASVKAFSPGSGVDPAQLAEVNQLQAELEAWAAREGSFQLAMAPSHVWQAVANVKAKTEMEALEADLMRWANDPENVELHRQAVEAEPAAVAKRRWDQRNAYSNGLAAWKAAQATTPGCGHCQWCQRGAPSNCVYR